MRSGLSPLEQVTRRLSEIEQSGLNTSKLLPKAVVSVKEKDCCFLLKDDRFAFVRQKNVDGTLACEILEQRHTSSFFEEPCSSKLLNIVWTGNGQGRRRNELLRETDLFRKVVCLRQESGCVHWVWIITCRIFF